MTMETHRTGGNMAAEAKSDAPIEELFINGKKASMDELKKISSAIIKEMKVEKMGNGKSRIIVTLKKYALPNESTDRSHVTRLRPHDTYLYIADLSQHHS